MALTDGENGGIPATMLVGPANMGGGYPVYNNQGGGFGDGNGWWIVLLIILLAAGNGFGNNAGGFGGQPIIVNDGNGVQNGFNQAAVMEGIGNVQNGISGLATQLCNTGSSIQQSLCNGFAGVNATVSGGFANAETAANARQMANMNQAFAAQTAMAQGFNALGTQFADCCCENRLASANLQNVIQTENCADRYEAAQNTRDIIQSQTAGTQAIIDKLCQLELDGKNDRIAELERQLNAANLAASQTAQTSRILADNAAQTVALEQYLNPVPVPAYVVQNPSCCNNSCGNF